MAVLLIHGGAGNISISKKEEIKYLTALNDILIFGQNLLENNLSASEVVALTVAKLEDCPLFNAGFGSVLTSKETFELDASIMDGKTLRTGAVAGLKRIKNPILLAKKVLEFEKHVFFIGEGAEDFARTQNLETLFVEENYFFTQERLNQLKNAQKENKTILDHDGKTTEKFGTVGAVALDNLGNLASATSTGGITNKMVGRVGDSAVIGAGTYANQTCAVSCTGTGEKFINLNVAFDVSALMNYANLNLEQATNKIIHEKLPKIDGQGGLIAVDNQGNFVLPFNTKGMFRGFADLKTKTLEVAIY